LLKSIKVCFIACRQHLRLQQSGVYIHFWSRIVIGLVSCAIGLHLALAIGLGYLAVAWKQRNPWAWLAVGLLTSVLGLLLLARSPRRVPREESDMQVQYLDGTRLQ
jgi:hypothetical protein